MAGSNEPERDEFHCHEQDGIPPVMCFRKTITNGQEAPWSWPFTTAVVINTQLEAGHRLTPEGSYTLPPGVWASASMERGHSKASSSPNARPANSYFTLRQSHQPTAPLLGGNYLATITEMLQTQHPPRAVTAAALKAPGSFTKHRCLRNRTPPTPQMPGSHPQMF